MNLVKAPRAQSRAKTFYDTFVVLRTERPNPSNDLILIHCRDQEVLSYRRTYDRNKQRSIISEDPENPRTLPFEDRQKLLGDSLKCVYGVGVLGSENGKQIKPHPVSRAVTVLSNPVEYSLPFLLMTSWIGTASMVGIEAQPLPNENSVDFAAS